MDRGLRLTQTVIGFLAVALVASLFLFGMVGGGAPADQQPTVSPSARPSPSELGEEDRLPGELPEPLDSIEVFDVDEELNPDRQLDYEAQGDPGVEFAAGLPDLRAYAEQSLDWAECGEATECATVLAPLDWEDPAAAAIELAVNRVASPNPVNGPLFVNPGGPGASGREFAASFAPDHWQGYDIVGFDPRGTGGSTHVVCGTLEETDEILGLDGSPDDDAEDRALQDGYRDFAQQCRDGSGELLDHLSSVEVARDMDLLRHLLGAEKLNFFGVSYGTYIGAMYAELFPDTSGRLILDAAVEITDAEPIYQIEGFERAFVAWADWCAGQEVCSLNGPSSAELQEQVSEWLDSLDQSPLPVGDRLLTQTHAATGIALFLYGDSSAYRVLALALQAAMRGDGEALLASADQLNGRGTDRYDTIAYAFPAMLCADWPDEGVDEVQELAAEGARRAPVLGRHMGITYACELWTAESNPPYKLTAEGADPILVIGGTGDSATPYEQAVRMAEQLEPATLLTYDGPGHGAVTGPSECVADAVDRYLADGTLPDEGTRCT
ncbi:alpha/beta hydrolase [Tessaracoccus oleiagri]|uniref:TAP-like protein n=1 Tax=Tessaracoccus oleiagri TaxID=686624 RepID=A0A1G9N060_9ACTN|nr:alpha/beta hydrolase [Tessaracoccus oleiagri]SDL79255.1 TAP-like protein [Tessaracoccus oleiagri]